MKFGQNIVRYIVIGRHLGDNRVKKLNAFLQASRGACIDDPKDRESINENLRCNGGVYFTDTAVYCHNGNFTQGTLIKFEHCDFRHGRIFQMRKKGG